MQPHSDLTRAVDLRSPAAVLAAVDAILREAWGPFYGQPLLAQAIGDLAAAFRGDYPGLLRCDTHYHDLRHALDATLAMARLLGGYAKAPATDVPIVIDAEHALLGMLLTLFHDVGLLRRAHEGHIEGASLGPVHEQRSVDFVADYLSRTHLAHLADKAVLIMVTRMDRPLDRELSLLDRTLASLMGTADLASQLADRYYLEKCRDFLYLEFVAIGRAGRPDAEFPDQETLLRKTPEFFIGPVARRLQDEYDNVLRFMRVHFGGECPYTDAMVRNFHYLETVLLSGVFADLRRVPQRVIDSV